MADRIPLVFFRTTAGNEPVRAWLKEMPQADRNAVGMDLQRVRHRWPVGMPLARPLGNGLWEVRTSLASHRIARVIFCFHDEELVALNGFIKKSQNTPQDELELALTRKKEHGEMTKKKKNPHRGSTLDGFLKEESVLEEFRAVAVKEVIAWQIAKAMKDKKLSKNKMATLMQTSRAQLDRLLDPEQGNVTLETLHRAAHVLGRELRIELAKA